jgi:ribonuclease HI
MKVRDKEVQVGPAMLDDRNVIWAEPLLPNTLVQKAELIALIKALELDAGKKVNIYTDSRYAFAKAHIHGAIHKERGLLTSGKRNKKQAGDFGSLGCSD